MVPLIGKQLEVSSGDLNWVTAITLLVSGVSVPLLSKLGDIYGHRRIIRITMVMTAAGTIMVATADSFGVLLAGRALTGVFAAWLPLEFAIVRDRVQGKSAGAAIGLLVGALTLGGTIGALGVGLLSEQTTDVHALLWFPAAAILLCLPVAFFLIPESTSRSQEKIDWVGAVLLTAGLGSLLIALARGGVWGWGSAGILTLFAAAAVILAVFVRVELRTAEPLVDLRMMAGRNLAPLYVLSFVLGFSLYGAQTANTTFMATPSELGLGFGFGTLQLALMALPLSLGALVASTVADRLVNRWGARTVVAAGFGAVAISYAFLVTVHTAPWQLAVAGVISGAGVGLALGSLPTLIMAELPAEQTGIGTGLYNTLKTLAGSVSGAVFAVVMNQHLLKLPVPGVKLADETGYVIVWTTCGVVGLLGVVVALLLKVRSTTSAAPAPVAAPVPA
ncbi:MFS transporter [Actinoplanes sp. OR16]|nr:MFS transporter [Actinoplanes sp. OR16]